MDELISFLTVRLGEDAETAQACVATDGRWRVIGDAVLIDSGPDLVAADMNDAEHIGRWDPYRVLAEVNAKQQIIATATTHFREAASPDSLVSRPATMALLVLEPVLQQLATPYADHEDYREQWRP
ncbi:DUF6221 family protein [Streptomyces tsukubensis]|uniref:DUF6221 family protein n=1 Tax=Streptomyces tsukubensis TaxID=83656 RepID=UPI0036BAD377